MGIENDEGEGIILGSETLKQEVIFELRTEKVLSQYCTDSVS